MAALEDAKANPDHFSMSSWNTGFGRGVIKAEGQTVPPCGTTACYAGFVALRVAPAGTKIVDAHVCIPDEKPVHVEIYAEDALEISPAQGGTLFFLADVEEVETALKHLADNPDVSGDYLWEVASGKPEDDDKEEDEDDWIYASVAVAQ
jgi:hypothetical protein